MARISQDDFSSQSDSQEAGVVTVDAHGQDKIEVPGNEFIADSNISREGQDLVLETPNGETLIVSNYFTAEPAPVIESPDGSVLTNNLINSFLESSSSQFAQTASMTDVSPVGAVEEVEGNVTITRADGTTEPAMLGAPIYNGDVIQTTADGAANIVFIDETSMAVSENARLAIDEYQYDPSTESGETNLSVLRGVFVFTSGLIGRDDPDDVQIDTPVGSIGIRGTIIAGKIQPGGESEVTVVEGAIVIKNGVMETTLSQQYETVKLGGFNDNMQDLGVKSAGDVGKTYGSVSDVVPKLFSSINDSAKEEQTPEATEEKQEAAEEIIENQEPEAEEVIEQQLQEDPTLDPLAEDLGLNNEPLKNPINLQGEKEFKPVRDYNSYNNDGNDSSFDDTIYYNGPQGPDGPTFDFKVNPLFEQSNTGDVVATIRIWNAPSGMTYNLIGPGAANFTVFPVSNGFAEVKLSAAGAIATGGAVGTALGSITLQAIFPDAHIVDWTVAPVTQDAAVNIGAPGGLDYHVSNAPNPVHEKIGDFNGDGIRDYIDGNPFANSGDGVVNIIDGSTNTPMHNLPGTTGLGLGHSVAGVGDVDNDGYADVVAGGPNAGNGEAHLINGSSGAPSTTPTFGGSAGDDYGWSVSSAGDFDGDGKSDYAVTAPRADGPGTDRGALHIETAGGSIIIDGHADFMELGEQVSYLGDIDGDGLSDLMVSAKNTVSGNYEAYIVNGGTGGGNTASLDTVSTTQQIAAIGGVGDFNGDGYDDFAVSLDDGTDINTYIVYGQSSPFSTMDLSFLENPDNALKIHEAGVSGNQYQITSVGDVNGDGFDDIQVGTVGGPQHTVRGDIGGGAPYATDGSATDGDGNTGVLSPANGSVKSLVGDVHFRDNNQTGLSMRGGDGKNDFSLQNNTFLNIDGGSGNQDTIRYGVGFGTLDFTSINFEQISQIEQIQFSQDNATIRLSAENIFNMLKTSDDGTLTIELGSTSGTPATIGTLLIEAGSDYSDDATGVVNALNEEGVGATHVGTSGGYDHFQIGGYDLYIDTGLTTQVVV